MNTPVLLVTFNRLDYLEKVFDKIKKIKPKKLYLSSDGAREDKGGEKEIVETIRSWMLNQINWECDVKTRFLDKNSGGCANGVSGAINWFFENEEQGIILEDDCLPSDSFFDFCESLLDKYQDNKNVFSICGYLPTERVESEYAYEFASVSHCWGWATWKDRWQKFTLDMSKFSNKDIKSLYHHVAAKKYWQLILQHIKNHEINSWYFPWNFCIAKNNGLTIFPTKNLISNIGDCGEHYESKNKDQRLNSKTFELIIDRYREDFDTKKMDIILWKYFYDKQSCFHETNTCKYYLSKYKNMFSFKNILNHIFSIKNEANRKHKVVTILFIKIKIKRKKHG